MAEEHLRFVFWLPYYDEEEWESFRDTYYQITNRTWRDEADHIESEMLKGKSFEQINQERHDDVVKLRKEKGFVLP